MSTDAPDLSGIAGADAGGPSDGASVELEELAHAITGDGAQGAAAAPATPPTEPPAAAAPTVIPSGPVPPPPSELVHSAASSTVGETPTVVATPASEAVRHARSHVRADTPAGPRTRARPIFLHPHAGTTHTSGETPAAGDSSAMETRMNTAQPASHVSLGKLAHRALTGIVGGPRQPHMAAELGRLGVGAPERPSRTRRPATPAKRPEGGSRPHPGMGRNAIELAIRRGR